MNQTITLLILQNVFGCPIVYEKKNPKKLFKLEGNHGDQLLVSPIEGGTSSSMLNAVDCITSEMVDFSGFLTELTRNSLGIHSEFTRNPLGIHSESTRNSLGIHSESTRNSLGIHSESTRNPLGIDTDDAPEYLGKTNYLFPKLSQNQLPHLKKLCIEIESLLHKKINDTSKHESLKASKKQYEEYAEILEAQTTNMLNDLERLKIKLSTDIQKQKKGRINQGEVSERKRTYKTILGVIVTLTIVATVFFFFWLAVAPLSHSTDEFTPESYADFEHKADSLDVAKSNSNVSHPKKLWTKSKVEELITHYQKQQGVKAYKFTREKIYSEIKNKNLTDYEVKLIIERYLNKLKK